MTDFPCVNSILIDRHLKEQEDREWLLEQKTVEDEVYLCTSCDSVHLNKSDGELCCGEIPKLIWGFVCKDCNSAYQDSDDAKWCCS